MRTTEEVDLMIGAIEYALSSLPENNSLVDSTAEKEQMKEEIESLKKFKADGSLSLDKYDEVRMWLEKNPSSFLGDYIR